MNHTNVFTQGYICAVATLIRMNGNVETSTRELYQAGVGRITFQNLKQTGVDYYDLEIIKKHWKELNHR